MVDIVQAAKASYRFATSMLIFIRLHFLVARPDTNYSMYFVNYNNLYWSGYQTFTVYGFESSALSLPAH